MKAVPASHSTCRSGAEFDGAPDGVLLGGLDRKLSGQWGMPHATCGEAHRRIPYRPTFDVSLGEGFDLESSLSFVAASVDST